ncbi:MAG TPA: hypothetical protein VFQ54_05285, partial [Thermomicrobiales bacterium]|nr:hypothetical protein [Thermomicrobiales bacterium]
MTVLTDAYSALRHHRYAKRFPDVIALAVVALIAAMVAVRLFNGQTIVLGRETIVRDLPMWTYLGERLHSLELPAWNPFQFGGIPFAADPASGWMYLPVVILFALFSVTKATAALLVAHFAIAGIGIFIFARVIGIERPAAATAGIAFISSNWFYTASFSDPTQVAVASWLPWALLFTELAIRPETLFRRIAFTGLAAASFSQILGIWYGNGAFYAVILLVAWLAYRTLVETWGDEIGLQRHLIDLAIVLAGVIVWTVGLGAAGLFPRALAEKTSQFSLPIVDFSGWNLGKALTGDGAASPGDVVIYLAIIGAFVAGRKFCNPFFIGAVILAFLVETDQFMVVGSLPIAILAGIGVTMLITKPVPDRQGVIAIGAMVVVFLATLFSANHMTETERMVEFALVVALSALILARDMSSWRYLLIAFALLFHATMLLDRVDLLKYG